MFGRVIIDHIKMNIRSPRYIFWTLAFPLGLGTLFFFAFSSIYSSETSSPIPVVYEVSDDAIQEYKTMQAFSNLDQEKINAAEVENNRIMSEVEKGKATLSEIEQRAKNLNEKNENLNL